MVIANPQNGSIGTVANDGRGPLSEAEASELDGELRAMPSQLLPLAA